MSGASMLESIRRFPFTSPTMVPYTQPLASDKVKATGPTPPSGYRPTGEAQWYQPIYQSQSPNYTLGNPYGVSMYNQMVPYISLPSMAGMMPAPMTYVSPQGQAYELSGGADSNAAPAAESTAAKAAGGIASLYR